MANSSQARKRARQQHKQREHNIAQRSMVRTVIKAVQAALRVGNREQAEEAYRKAVPVLDRMADKGIIHANKAARHKRRLNHHLHALGKES